MEQNIYVKAKYKKNVYNLGKGLVTQQLIKEALMRIMKQIKYTSNLSITYQDGSNSLKQAFIKCIYSNKNSIKVTINKQKGNNTHIEDTIRNIGNSTHFDETINDLQHQGSMLKLVQVQTSMIYPLYGQEATLCQETYEILDGFSNKQTMHKSKKEEDIQNNNIQNQKQELKNIQIQSQQQKQEQQQLESQHQFQKPESEKGQEQNQSQQSDNPSTDQQEQQIKKETQYQVSQKQQQNDSQDNRAHQVYSGLGDNGEQENHFLDVIKKEYQCFYCLQTQVGLNQICKECQNSRFLPPNHKLIAWLQKVIEKQAGQSTQQLAKALKQEIQSKSTQKIEQQQKKCQQVQISLKDMYKNMRIINQKYINLQEKYKSSQNNNNNLQNDKQQLCTKNEQLQNKIVWIQNKNQVLLNRLIQLQKIVRKLTAVDQQQQNSFSHLNASQSFSLYVDNKVKVGERSQKNKYYAQINLMQQVTSLKVGDKYNAILRLRNLGIQKWPQNTFLLQKISRVSQRIQILKPGEQLIIRDSTQVIKRQGQKIHKKYQIYYQEKVGQKKYLSNEVSIFINVTKKEKITNKCTNTIGGIGQVIEEDCQTDKKNSNLNSKMNTSAISPQFIKKINQLKKQLEMGHKQTIKICQKLQELGINQENYQFHLKQEIESIFKIA